MTIDFNSSTVAAGSSPSHLLVAVPVERLQTVAAVERVVGGTVTRVVMRLREVVKFVRRQTTMIADVRRRRQEQPRLSTR